MPNGKKPPFKSMTATFVGHRYPQWKLHSSLGNGRKAISFNLGWPGSNDFGQILELWGIQEVDGKLEWLLIWEGSSHTPYADLPWVKVH
jgi:hypothetical protein